MGEAERALEPKRKLARPATLVAFAALFLSAVMALVALMVWQNYRTAVTAGEARALASAHVVAAHVEWMFAASDQALRRIDDALGDGPLSDDAPSIKDITQAVGDLPVGFEYSVFDDAGILRLSSLERSETTRIGDRDYFRSLKDGKTVIVSPQLSDRLTGSTAFVIARRIARNGVFRGVASIAIPLARINQFWSSMALGPHSTVSIVREDGWVVARHPSIAKPLNIASSPLFTTWLPQSPSGVYHNAASPADGRGRIVGYWRVEGWPLIAIAGVDDSEAMEMFWSGLRSQFVLGLPLVFLLLLSATWIARLLRAYALRNEELELSIEQNNFLLREIHHRVKNNLQAVSALVRLQPLPETARTDMIRRISAMVAVHEQIYRNDQFADVEVAAYAERLIREIAAGYPGAVDLDVALEPVAVKPDHALPLGLIINEVVSNAFKHAFAITGRGRLTARLTHDGAGRACLTIADDGPGLPAEVGRGGMGSRLIGGFVAQLGGSYRYESEGGTRFVMEFPAMAASPAEQGALSWS